MTVSLLRFFRKVPWVGLQFVSVVFSVHTHLLLLNSKKTLVEFGTLP